MIYKKLGKTGVDISALGYGCMRLPEIEKDGKWTIDYEKSDEMIRRAYELGVNYFDTAFYYCHSNSEIAVGRALKPIRDKVYISTKCPMEDVKETGDFRKILEKSLEKLGTDYVDFYHFWSINKKVFDEKIIGLKLIPEALKLKKEGKIRHISFSFHDHPKYIKDIIDAAPEMETMLIQYSLLNRDNQKGIEYAASKGLGVIAMGPVAGGRLAAPNSFKEKHSADLQIADYDLALRYVCENENIACALSGMENVDMVEKNANVISNSKPLNTKEKKLIVNTRKVVKKFNELYCTGCGYCQPCPKKIEIPKIFEAYTMENVYGLSSLAKDSYQGYIKNGGKLISDCADCGFCEGKCPQKLKIREQMKKVEERLSLL